MDEEVPHEWSVEILSSTLADLLPDAKIALIGLNGRVEAIGDVMAALMLADNLLRALKCQNRNGANTQEKSRDS